MITNVTHMSDTTHVIRVNHMNDHDQQLLLSVIDMKTKVVQPVSRITHVNHLNNMNNVKNINHLNHVTLTGSLLLSDFQNFFLH